MKIVYCVTQLHGSGGIERVITTKANALVDRGHDVTIITTDQKGGKPFFELDKRIRTYDLGLNYKGDYDNPIWIRLYRYLKKKRIHKQKLTKLLYSIKADIVISTFMEEASFLCEINDGSRKIVESHSSILQHTNRGRRKKWDLRRLLDRFYQYREAYFGKKFDYHIVLTNEDLEYRGYPANAAVISNFVDDGFNTKTCLVKPKGNTVLAVGRHSQEKNYSELIDIWSRVAHRCPSWILKIVGSGHLFEDLKHKILTLGLDSSVVLVSHTREIKNFYSEASIFVMCSKYEGMPMVLLESQCMGIPAVCYSFPCGPKDLIRDGENGLLVPVGNKDLFATKLERLIKDEQLRLMMADNAQGSSEKYLKSNVIDQWERLFNDIMSQGV